VPKLERLAGLSKKYLMFLWSAMVRHWVAATFGLPGVVMPSSTETLRMTLSAVASAASSPSGFFTDSM
jgi:hypothetical protein